MPATPIPPCRSCGLCCVDWSGDGQVPDCTESDVRRLGVARRLLTGDRAISSRERTQRSGPFRGLPVVVCAALTGSVGHRCACSIYARRPVVCRSGVVRGDRACLAIRAMAEREIADAAE